MPTAPALSPRPSAAGSFRALALLLCLPVVVAACTASAADKPARSGPVADVLLSQVKEETLPNGLRVLVLERRAAPVVVTDLFYKVGSAHEAKGKTGLAHFLEHMMFKGTAKLAKGEIDALTLVHAGENNAETWEDFTHYWFRFPSDRWEKALEIEADRMTGLVIDAKELEAERQVVLEERRKDRDTPFGRLSETAGAISYLSHPYRNPIIGWLEEIEGLTADDLTAFYRRHYRPDNAVLVIVGDVKADEALAKVRAAFGAIPSGKPAGPPPATEPAQNGVRRFTLQDGGGLLNGLFCWHTVPRGHADAPALEVLARVLGGGPTARLTVALQAEDNWSGEVSVSHEARQTAGQLQATISGPADFKPDAVEAVVHRELRKIIKAGITQKELDRVRSQLLADFQFSQEDPQDLAFGLGQAAVGGSWRQWPEFQQALAKLTRDDVRKAAGAYLTDARLTIGWTVPVKRVDDKPEPPAKPAAKGSGEHRVIQPVPLKGPLPTGAPKLAGWAPQRYVLDNGLTVIVQRRQTPVVALRAYVDAGPLREAKPGAAYVTGALLDAGTKNRDSESITSIVEGIGATLEVGATGLALKVKPEDLGTAVALFGDLLANSQFPDEDFDFIRNNAVNDLGSEAEDPEKVAYRTLARRVYGDHPASRNPRGTAESLAALKREDVVAHHKAYFVPSNTILAVAGDFDPAELRSMIETHFGGWKGAKPKFPPLPELKRGKGGTENISQKREQVQIYIGHLGVRRNDPDWYALTVMDNILGAGPGLTNRLSRSLRDEKGLAYTVEADIAGSASDEPGLFSAYMAVKPGNEEAAVAGILEEIRRITSGDATDEEFRRAKAFLSGNWVFSYLTSDQVAEKLVEIERFQLGLDFPERFVRQINDVTLDQVRRAAAKHLSVEACHIVQLGPVK